MPSSVHTAPRSHIGEGTWPTGALRPDSSAPIRTARLVALRMMSALDNGDAAARLSPTDLRAARRVVDGMAWPDLALMARFEQATGAGLWRPGDSGAGPVKAPRIDDPVRLADVFELTGRCTEGLTAVAEVLGVRVPALLRLARIGSVLVFAAFGEAWLPTWHIGAPPQLADVLRALPGSLPAVKVDRWMVHGEVRASQDETLSPLMWLKADQDPETAVEAAREAARQFGW